MARSRESIDKAVEVDLVALAQNVFADNLVSVIAYGSYLRDTFRPGASDVNVLFIIREAIGDQFDAFGRDGHRLMRRFTITPLVLTRDEFRSSSDVFPMEYSDLVDVHRVLYGEDVTSDLSLSAVHLRHEVEHQLRGSLVSLRQLAVAAGRRRPFVERALRRELAQWQGTLWAVLRGVLRLYGYAPSADPTSSPIPNDPAALVDAVNRAVGFEPGPLLTLARCRNGACPDSREMIAGLLDRLSELVRVVDRYQRGTA
ncbi:MAG: hypothetical protein EA382_04050 [Spirochaetaceae bacterium]|nr:MAG: hypothetical protein EA382_04050 [Spirochaetaceae bacterium]